MPARSIASALAALVAGSALTALLVPSSAFAIDPKYARQLERSGCTQVSESQGCDITKTRAQNAKAGFATPAPASPYTGRWVARSSAGARVAAIRIDAAEHVLVNGKKVKARRSDGALVFKSGTITFTIQGDRRLKGEDTWADSGAGTRGLIDAE